MSNERISDIFDYGDGIVSPDAGIRFDPAEIKELTMKKIHDKETAPADIRRATAKSRRARRTALIAAIAAVLLVGTAFAVRQYTMRDRTLLEAPLLTAEDGHEIYQYSASGPGAAAAEATPDTAGTESSPGGTHFLTSGEAAQATAADSANAEYLAAQEWWTCILNYSEDTNDELLPQDDPARLYGAGWRSMREKLTEIAGRYGLRLYKSEQTFSDLDGFFAAIGTEPFAELTGSYDAFECDATVYDEGSFTLGGVRFPAWVVAPAAEEDRGNSVAIGIHRDAKGSLPGAFLIGDDPSQYTYESYVTAGGTAVDLALGDRYSFLFAELDGCWISVLVNGGRLENMPYLPTIDTDTLRQIADGIDFAALDLP